MRAFIIIIGLCLSFFSQSTFALKEKHLIIVRHGEAEHNLKQEYNSNPKHPKYKPSHLTEAGRQQVKETAELLLTHGFDNRNIAAVYVSPLPRTVETAQIFSEIGLFAKDKIHVDSRLIEVQVGDREGLVESQFSKDTWWIGRQDAKLHSGETYDDVRKRILAIYDEVEKEHPEGHVMFVTDGRPAMELIESLTKTKMKLQTAQAYLVPLNSRNELT